MRVRGRGALRRLQSGTVPIRRRDDLGGKESERGVEMRTLGIHSKGFRFESRDKAIDGAEVISPDQHEFKLDRECLVVFMSVEKGDAESPVSVARQLAADTIKRA